MSIILDDTLQLSISNLKNWGCLQGTMPKCYNPIWKLNGEKTSSISMTIDHDLGEPVVLLKYKHNEETYNYVIRLYSKPSNLGKGKIVYFECPVSFRLCRKLYLVNGLFVHRKAFKGVLYECQTKCKQYRKIEKTFGLLSKLDNWYEQLNRKYAKHHYAGKPTKKYLSLMEKVITAEGSTLDTSAFDI